MFRKKVWGIVCSFLILGSFGAKCSGPDFKCYQRIVATPQSGGSRTLDVAPHEKSARNELDLFLAQKFSDIKSIPSSLRESYIFSLIALLIPLVGIQMELDTTTLQITFFTQPESDERPLDIMTEGALDSAPKTQREGEITMVDTQNEAGKTEPESPLEDSSPVTSEEIYDEDRRFLDDDLRDIQSAIDNVVAPGASGYDPDPDVAWALKHLKAYKEKMGTNQSFTECVGMVRQRLKAYYNDHSRQLAQYANILEGE